MFEDAEILSVMTKAHVQLEILVPVNPVLDTKYSDPFNFFHSVSLQPFVKIKNVHIISH